MQFSKLGNTDLKVSKICLGTMTFGEQNSESEAHAQLDYALDHGVNFVDAAEMYPVPPKQETQGLTEAYIGNWIKTRGHREQLVLATKVAGPATMTYLRNGPQLTPEHINAALHASLQRLQTDYIDVYQVHWPARNTNFFGKLGYRHDDEDETTTVIEDTYACLMQAVEQGKIRHIGVSNETPWGIMQYQACATANAWPAMVSVQNPYNLLNRTYEVGLAEVSHRENIGLLAYSPLGFGVLTGKYTKGAKPANARLTLFERFDRYQNTQGLKATDAYVELAHQQGLSPAQMALAFVTSRPFVTASIIGATSLEQLRENIDSIHVTLSKELLAQIEAVHLQHPNPCP